MAIKVPYGFEVTLTGKTAHGAMPEQGIMRDESINKVLIWLKI
ncbi:hypothetical protein [Staphylococcus equorum]|nr:hypothetical protein [Staphylococcus equorum]